MSIPVKCNQCGKSFNVPDERAGQQGRCACGATLVVPQATRVFPGVPPPAEKAAAPPGTVDCPACGAANPPGYGTCNMCDAPAPGRGKAATPTEGRPKAAPRRRSAALIAVPVVLLLLLGGGAYWYLMMASPRQVAERYLEASKSGKPGRFKRFLTAASAAKIDQQAAQLEQFQQQFQALGNDPKMAEFKKKAEEVQSQVQIEVTQVTVQGNTATARYKTSLSGGMGMMGGFSMEQPLCLAREGLGWKVDLIKTEEVALGELRKQFGNFGGQDFQKLLEQMKPSQ